MRIATIVCGGLLGGIASSALACDLPKLLIVPPKDEIAGKEAEVRAAANEYFTAMQAYAACVQAELLAAGGEAAPPIIRRVLIDRNNAAAEEMQFMMKAFTDALGAADAAAAGPAPAEPAAGNPAPPAAR